jgi:DNA processing protein
MSDEERPRPTAFPKRFASGDGNRAAVAVLLGLSSLTPRKLLVLADRHRTASAVLAAVRDGAGASERDRDRARTSDGAAVIDAATKASARFVVTGDREYVPSLRHLADPPAGVFVRGADLRSVSDRVCVVGARNASPDGCDIAMEIGRGLGGAGVCVVSGAARGIDTCAHRGALAVGGATVAVLGSGIDVAYPRANAALIDRIAEVGTVVSEYPPGVPAEPFRFPARNRIAAALARAVVVVEGAAGSGSMITADHAIDLGLDVFAIPGPVTSELAHVPLQLIRDGATMVRGADDLLADLGIALPARDAPPAEWAAAVAAIPALTDDQRSVLLHLVAASTAELLAERAGMDLPRVMSALTVLEMRRLVRARGGRYERPLPVRPP